MSIAIITGSAGLIGSEASRHYVDKGMEVIGIDNDMRRAFFGDVASTDWQKRQLERELKPWYRHEAIDVRDTTAINRVFRKYAKHISLVIHTAAQPSHDWAAREPHTDFSINALGTLNLLEATRRYTPDSVFIFTSTNKVYGDTPNRLPLVELERRWEIAPEHPYAEGVPEEMSIDQTLHSLFGASKVAADVAVQEYGRYFGMRTACFRGGCLTGPNHSGAKLHGFLAYLMQCAVLREEYTVLGYKGKQVRDNIHSSDLIRAFDAFFEAPRCGEVYNIGGGRYSNCSILEAIQMCEQITQREMIWNYKETNRTGDHMWWISDLSKFSSHYPSWQLRHDIPSIMREIHDANIDRWYRKQLA